MAEQERRTGELRQSYGRDTSTVREQRRQEVDQQRLDARTEDTSPGFGELYGIAADLGQVYNSFQSQKELGTGAYDEYVPPEEREFTNEQIVDKLGLGYTKQEMDILKTSRTTEQFNKRLDKIKEQREQYRLLNKAGLKGIGAQFAAGMTDPTLLPLYFLTGGTGAVARAGSLGTRVLASGAAGTAEGLAVGAVLAPGDSQSDWRSVVLSGLTGGGMSASFTLGARGMRRIVKGKEPPPRDPDEPLASREDEVMEAAMEADRIKNKEIKDAQDDMVVKDLERRLNITSVHNMDAKANLESQLLDISTGRMSRKERADLSEELTQRRKHLKKVQGVNERVDVAPKARGTKKAMKEVADRTTPQRLNARRRLATAEKKVADIEERFKADEPKQKAWADLSRIRQGQMPKGYQELFDSLEKASRRDKNTPFQNLESDNVRKLAKEARDRRDALAAQRAAEARQVEQQGDSTKVDPEGDTTPDTGDAGAARVKGAQDESEMYPLEGSVNTDEKLYEMQQVGESIGGLDRLRKLAGLTSRRLSSAYSNLAQSKSNIVRGIAHTILNDPQAASRGHISSAERAASYENRLLKVEGGREMGAMGEYAKEQGSSGWRMAVGEGEIKAEFDNQIILQMKGIDQGSPAIRKAAEARADVEEAALEMSKRTNRRGFENVESDRGYWSTIFNPHKMSRQANLHSRDEVIETLTGGYMNGKYKLGESAARKVARAQYARTMEKNLAANESQSVGLSRNEYGVLREELEAAGVPTNRIDDYLNDLETVRENEGISNRAKFSLGVDMTYSRGSIRMVDLLDTSKSVSDRYAQEAAAGSALARNGFASREDLELTLDQAQRQALSDLDESGLRGKEYDKAAKEIKYEIETLQNSIKLLHRESLDESSGVVEASRRARKLTNLSMLQWNGIVSTAEGANALVTFGTSGLRSFRLKDFFSFGRIRDSEDLQGMYDIVGAYGQLEASIRDRDYTLQTLDEGSKTRMGRIFDNFTGSLSEKSQLFSGFRSMQHGLENVALRAMQDRFVRIGNGKVKMKDRDFDELRRSGLREDQIDTLFKSIRDNPEYGNNGKQIFSGKGLSESDFDDVSAAMGSLLSRQMQKNFVGDTPIFMEKELGKFLTTFRAFSIASAEKQLASGMRGDNVGMFLKLSLATTLAYGSYSSRAWLRSQTDDDPEGKFEKYMEPWTAAQGTLNMSPHLGIVGMGTEFFYGLGISGDDDNDGSMVSRSGSRPITAGGLIPTVGLAEDAFTASRNIIGGTASAAFGGDGERAVEGAKDAYDMLPIINSTVWGTAIGIAASDK